MSLLFLEMKLMVEDKTTFMKVMEGRCKWMRKECQIR
jgi:hypothetical protein